MNRQFTFLLLMISLFVNSNDIVAQDTLQGIEVREAIARKNIIRVNITNPLIFGDRSLVLGYERMLKEYQSFSVNFGLATFPKFDLISIVDDSIVQLFKDSKDRGFNVTGDYRFYLAGVNKFKAPRGIYIGPYISHAFMGRENRWHLSTNTFEGDVITDFRFYLTLVGGQLGYQFILWKRVALDFVLLGPSIGWYSMHAKFDTTLDPEDEELLYEKINEALEDRFPGYSIVVDDVDFKKTGSSNTQGLGYRYVVHLGFLF